MKKGESQAGGFPGKKEGKHSKRGGKKKEARRAKEGGGSVSDVNKVC